MLLAAARRRCCVLMPLRKTLVLLSLLDFMRAKFGAALSNHLTIPISTTSTLMLEYSRSSGTHSTSCRRIHTTSGTPAHRHVTTLTCQSRLQRAVHPLPHLPVFCRPCMCHQQYARRLQRPVRPAMCCLPLLNWEISAECRFSGANRAGELALAKFVLIRFEPSLCYFIWHGFDV